MKKLILVLSMFATAAIADEIGCVDTTFKLIGANDKICVSAFSDPDISGVTCHISQAKTGGIGGAVGLAQDPSKFSLACRQTGPITLPQNVAKVKDKVFNEATSIFFKSTHVTRLWDAAHNTLIYLATSDKLIEGSPSNSISTVPVMPWGK